MASATSSWELGTRSAERKQSRTLAGAAVNPTLRRLSFRTPSSEFPAGIVSVFCAAFNCYLTARKDRSENGSVFMTVVRAVRFRETAPAGAGMRGVGATRLELRSVCHVESAAHLPAQLPPPHRG